jgi:hypothetical protein
VNKSIPWIWLTASLLFYVGLGIFFAKASSLIVTGWLIAWVLGTTLFPALFGSYSRPEVNVRALGDWYWWVLIPLGLLKWASAIRAKGWANALSDALLGFWILVVVWTVRDTGEKLLVSFCCLYCLLEFLPSFCSQDDTAIVFSF